MEQRSIGGFKVSVLGLGTGRLASLGAGGSLSDAARLLDAAADLGISFIDTADLRTAQRRLNDGWAS